MTIQHWPNTSVTDKKLVTKTKETESPGTNSALCGHIPGLCLLACSLEVKAQGKLLHSMFFFMRGKHLQSVQDNSIAVTGACTVCASMVPRYQAHAIEPSVLSAENLVSLSIFCTHFAFLLLSPVVLSQQRLFFSGELRHKSSYLFQGQSVLVLLCEENWHSWDSNSWI